MSFARLSRIAVVIFCLATASACRRASTLAPPPESPRLWLWLGSLLRSQDNLDSTIRIIDRARRAGYTGIAFWDVSFTYMMSPDWPDPQGVFLKRGMEYAKGQNLQILIPSAPFGFSNDLVRFNPNWAEGQRVIGSPFQVDPGGRSLLPRNTFAGIRNGDFESGRRAWFGNGDPGVDIDTIEKHSGLTSGIVEGASRNSRFSQLLRLTPWRQYHVRLFVRSEAYTGSAPVLEVFDAGSEQAFRMYKTLPVNPAQGWIQVDTTFNSQSSSSAWLYFGVWGAHSGTLWFDDVSVEETALVNLIRRPGAPLSVYDAKSGAVYRENADFNPMRDPQLDAGGKEDYHEPPAILLPATTRLRPGQLINVDYYAAQPLDLHRLGVCLTDPGLEAWSAENIRKVMAIAPPDASVFLQYDEMRQMHSCASCRSHSTTAGELLAWHAGKTMAVYRSQRPRTQFYAWSDMFDPYANARNNYYLVEGTIWGSWRGLPAEVTIMNWNLPRLRLSLEWFAGLNRKQPSPHRQIIAGYYDSHDGENAAADELRSASGIPGIDGLMYTSWEGDYSQVEAFAESARRNWQTYRESIH